MPSRMGSSSGRGKGAPASVESALVNVRCFFTSGPHAPSSALSSVCSCLLSSWPVSILVRFEEGWLIRGCRGCTMRIGRCIATWIGRLQRGARTSLTDWQDPMTGIFSATVAFGLGTCGASCVAQAAPAANISCSVGITCRMLSHAPVLKLVALIVPRHSRAVRQGWSNGAFAAKTPTKNPKGHAFGQVQSGARAKQSLVESGVSARHRFSTRRVASPLVPSPLYDCGPNDLKCTLSF